MNTNIENILALGRLYEFSTNKRFHLLKNEFINDKIGLKALELNNRIKEQSGIDLFEAVTDSDLVTYQKTLNRYISDSSISGVKSISIGDEIDLLKMSEEFSTDKLKLFRISVETFLKSRLKEFGITPSEVINYCFEADSAAYIEESGSIFVTKKINHKGRTKIILLHITNHDPNGTIEGAGYSTSLSYLDTELKTMDNVLIRMFLLFDFEPYIELISKPIRLFIKGIDLYSTTITINGLHKRVYRNILLPTHITSFIDALGYINFLVGTQTRGNPNVRIFNRLTESAFGVKVLLLYFIDFDKMSS